jgi:hypothetical protein
MNLLRISILLPVIALLLCASPDLVDPGEEGNGSETVARGVIVNSTGAPVAKIPVNLLPAGYDPVTHEKLPAQWLTFTDEKGGYHIDSIAAGTYSLEAGSSSTGLKALVKGIKIGGNKVEMVVDTGRLQKTGTILIQLNGFKPHSGDYIYLPGTNSFTVITAGDSTAGKTTITGVPSGTFTDLIYVAAADSQHTDLLSDTMMVYSGDTVALDFAAWKYSRPLFLNTSVSGADIQENLYNFPVLVRLTDATFDFSQAKSGGEDIRFAKSDGTLLPFEIERWNAAVGKSEIWVKVDSVRRNDSTQYIKMYWGNPDAAGSSNSSMVFDTVTGFQGVWHMGQEANTTAFDATANHYDGTPSGMDATSSVEGVIGNAQRFNGTSGFISLPGTAGSKLNFPQGGNFTLSAWVYTETLNNAAHYVISKSNNSYNLDLSSKKLWEIYDVEDGLGLQSIYAQPTLKQWKYLTGVCKGNDMRLYVDGVCMDSIPVITSGVSHDSKFDVQIGKRSDSDYGYWYGMLDEVCIMNVALSPNWIKLCYINQSADNKFVLFK